MKSIKEFKSEYKPSEKELLELKEYPGVTIKDFQEIYVMGRLNSKLREMCKNTGYYDRRGNLISVYKIKTESVMEFLRDIYKTTSNKYVQSVLTTVGQARKFTDKQLDVITEEIAKHDLFIVNL